MTTNTPTATEIRALLAETDRLTDAPWAVLTDAPRLALKERQTRLKVSLAEMARPVPA